MPNLGKNVLKCGLLPKKWKKKTGPLRRRPSCQRRLLAKTICQSIESHINRLSKPVTRKYPESDFFTMRKQTSVNNKVSAPWIEGNNQKRKMRRKKIKRKLKKTRYTAKAGNNIKPGIHQTSSMILPAQLSSSIANFEKSRINFLESLKQIQEEVLNLRLPVSVLDQAVSKISPETKPVVRKKKLRNTSVKPSTELPCVTVWKNTSKLQSELPSIKNTTSCVGIPKRKNPLEDFKKIFNSKL
uniref:Uncharacterized protein n=1 Tax=Clastoptera arizonana TaxID=38151 RepID=A0A1B6CU19_9HEMI